MQEFLTRSGLEVQFWLEQQWLIPEETSAWNELLRKGRCACALKSDFGVNDEGIDVILHLKDQLHGLRCALAQFHNEIRTTSV
jgi:chaperone modulatory protein CbpM